MPLKKNGVRPSTIYYNMDDNLSQYEEQLFELLISSDLENVKVAC
jgi:hypothetical protein